MSLFRRREPLHVKLAREGGVPLVEPVAPAAPASWETPGIHGVQRTREWDALTTVSAPDLEGERREFVSLAPGELIVFGDGDAESLAAAIEREVSPPYRAEAVRREGGLWAVAARRIAVVQLPETDGEEIELVCADGEHTLIIDGERSFGSIPALEQDDHVVRAHRLGGDVWEVESSPL